jgi:P4 family phage/plasmid primase-like protien
MSGSDDTAQAPSMQVPLSRNYRVLKVGSVTEMAEWLLGTIGDARSEDFGALAGMVFAAGRLWRCGPDCIWRALEEADVYQFVQHFDGARYVTPEGKTRCIQMSADLSKRVVRTIEAKTAEPSFFSHAPNGLAFRNGFLRVVEDGGCRLETLTPDHHVTRALPFDYNPVPAPEDFQHWKAFLTSCWGSSGPNGGPDVEAIALVHQMIGYLLSGSNAHQKIFLLLGPPRCGKGTICKLLMRMFGPDAGAFKLAGLDNNFALEGMLGRSICVDGDVRRSKGMNRDEGKIVERLLGISAGDPQEIPRKNKTALHLVLPTRLVIASNPPFSVRDVGSALASRIVTIPFSVSHLGSEDTMLEEKLASELPAIVALAMQAVRTLRARGRFVEPSTAAEMREEIERGQNPLREFFEEWCEFDAEARTGCGDLYRAMRTWAEENGNAAPSSQSFASALKQLGVKKMRPADPELKKVGRRPNFAYQGVRLLEAPEVAGRAPGAVAGLRRPANGLATVTPLHAAKSPAEKPAAGEKPS